MKKENSAEEEPSIEEILDSIRQIISDDEDDDTSADGVEDEAVQEPEDDFGASGFDDDVVELTEKVEEELPRAPLFQPEPEPAPVPPPAPPVEQKVQPAPPPPPAPKEQVVEIDMKDPQEEKKAEKPQAAPETSTESSYDDFSSLLSERAASAALGGFSDLARKTSVGHDGITLEEIVRTELNPLLRKWLDRHLPSIIERLVQEELEKISKRALEE